MYVLRAQSAKHTYDYQRERRRREHGRTGNSLAEFLTDSTMSNCYAMIELRELWFIA